MLLLSTKMTTQPIFKWTNTVLNDQYAKLLPTMNPLDHLRKLLKPHRCSVKMHDKEFIFEGTYQRMLQVHMVLSDYFCNLQESLISDAIVTFSPSSMDNVVEVESSDVLPIEANDLDTSMINTPLRSTLNEEDITVNLFGDGDDGYEDKELLQDCSDSDAIYVNIIMSTTEDFEATESSEPLPLVIYSPEHNTNSQCSNNVNYMAVKGETSRTQLNVKSAKNYEKAKLFKFFCTKCSFKSKRESAFILHQARHSKTEQLYTCKDCSFVTIKSATMQRHRVTQHPCDVVTCELCSFVTSDIRYMQKHMQRVHLNPKQERTVTEDSNLRKPNLLQRRKLCNSRKPNVFQSFKCQLCAFSSMVNSRYEAHLKTHEDTRPYLCAICGKCFKRVDTLGKHELLHAAPSVQFACTICGKSNYSQNQLNVHMSSVHVKMRSFLCEVCGASFKTKAYQQTHMRTIHVNPRSFSCDDCSRTFNTKFTLSRHLKMHRLEKKALKKVPEGGALQVYNPTQSNQIPIHLIPTNTILIQDSSQQHHDSLASITISESQLGEHTLSVLTPAETDTSFETAPTTALFYLGNYASY